MKNKLVWKKIRIANKITFLLGLFHRCCHSLMVGGRDFFNYSLVHIILPVFTLVIIERKGWDVDFIRVALHDHDVILFLFCRLVMKALFCVRQKCFSSFRTYYHFREYCLCRTYYLCRTNILFRTNLFCRTNVLCRTYFVTNLFCVTFLCRIFFFSQNFHCRTYIMRLLFLSVEPFVVSQNFSVELILNEPKLHSVLFPIKIPSFP